MAEIKFNSQLKHNELDSVFQLHPVSRTSSAAAESFWGSPSRCSRSSAPSPRTSARAPHVAPPSTSTLQWKPDPRNTLFLPPFHLKKTAKKPLLSAFSSDPTHENEMVGSDVAKVLGFGFRVLTVEEGLIVVVVEERVEDVVGEGEIVDGGEERVVLGIAEALLEPVVAEPRRGLDQGPPLVGEVLHRPVRHRHEQRGVGVQRGGGQKGACPRDHVHSHFNARHTKRNQSQSARERLQRIGGEGTRELKRLKKITRGTDCMVSTVCETTFFISTIKLKMKTLFNGSVGQPTDMRERHAFFFCFLFQSTTKISTYYRQIKK